MQAIWNRIESWLEVNAPEIRSDLLPGATDQEIHSTEEFTGMQFPVDVKTSYSIHNGQLGGAPPIIGEWQLLSLKALVSRWKTLKDLFDAGDFNGIKSRSSDPIRADWWNPKWLPLAYNGAGDYRCLDLDPAPGGQLGQIISFWHTSDRREIVADSFRAWLGRFADDLESGKYKVEDGQLMFSNQTDHQCCEGEG